ncbi:MAG: hypothetical protein A3F92_11110 [Candidatus Rokubacteria bacterium RIFCSPLOWO2_12_FULL_71_22]|nr:MAG: hypothetical protein A3F92_11110 [Candidatus Rokubacteria bacterium RIFCSPLOWO2_12_FULL_71_22]
MSLAWSRIAWDRRFARRYDATSSQLAEGLYAALRETLRASLFPGLVSGSRVLDAGCGPGHVTARFAQDAPQATVFALDFSSTMLGLAAATLARTGIPHYHLIQGDIHRLPFPDRSLDAVLSTASLKNWADPVVGLKEIHRVAKPNAPVALAEVNREATRDEKDAWKRQLARSVPGGPLARLVRTWAFEHVIVARSVGPGDVLKILRQTDFIDVDVRSVRGYPFLLATMRTRGLTA